MSLFRRRRLTDATIGTDRCHNRFCEFKTEIRFRPCAFSLQVCNGPTPQKRYAPTGMLHAATQCKLLFHRRAAQSFAASSQLAVPLEQGRRSRCCLFRRATNSKTRMQCTHPEARRGVAPASPGWPRPTLACLNNHPLPPSYSNNELNLMPVRPSL